MIHILTLKPTNSKDHNENAYDPEKKLTEKKITIKIMTRTSLMMSNPLKHTTWSRKVLM